MNFLWIFNAERSSFPSAVFTNLAVAESWISHHKLTGVLTNYPVDVGVYDYALESGLFTPLKDDQKTPMFIGRFSDAGLEHYHYSEGLREQAGNSFESQPINNKTPQS